MLRREDLPDGLLPAEGPIRITDRLWWVGCATTGRESHSYLLEQGEQSVLFHPGSASSIRQTLARVEQVVPFSSLRWFVCTHAEPDTAGALPLLDQLVHREDARLVVHKLAAEVLSHLNLNLSLHIIERDGDRLVLEDRILRFVATPHMRGGFVSYEEGSGTLFWGDLGQIAEPGQRFEAISTGDLEAICAFQAERLPHRSVLSRLLSQLDDLNVQQVAPRQGLFIPQRFIAELLALLGDVQCAIDRDELDLPERDDRPADDRLPDLPRTDNAPTERPSAAAPVQISPEQRYLKAVRDGLTGLYTPQHMSDTVSRWARFQDRDADQMVSVIVLDVDGMKGINVAFGNPVGDQVLARVAEAVRAQCRDEDLPVRIGGEVFALFLFGDNPDAAPSLASRIGSVVRNQTFATQDAPLRVTLSAGTTCRVHGEPMRQVLARADAARLASKAAGGDQVETR